MNDRFVIDDVEMRRSATWPGGPHVLSAELPDGRILGHVIPQEGEWLWRLADETEWHAPRPVEGNVARFIDQGGREAAILSLLEAIETRYPMADPEDPVDVLDESLTGTDPYAAPIDADARYTWTAGLADQSERDVMRVWAEDELAQVVEDHYWNFPGGRNSCMEFYSRPDFISESYVEWKAGLLSEGDLERTTRADTDPLGDPRAFGATTPTR